MQTYGTAADKAYGKALGGGTEDAGGNVDSYAPALSQNLSQLQGNADNDRASRQADEQTDVQRYLGELSAEQAAIQAQLEAEDKEKGQQNAIEVAQIKANSSGTRNSSSGSSGGGKFVSGNGSGKKYALTLTQIFAAANENAKTQTYVYREFNKPDLIVSEAAKAICDNTPENEKIHTTYCPPDMWARQKDTGKSMAFIFMENGIDILAASNDRVQGWLQVKEGLAIREARDEFTGEGMRRSRLHIMKNCVELIKHLPLLQFDAKNVNDVSKAPHDITHNTDALRYFCISYFSSAKEQKPEENYLDEYKKKLLSGKRNRRRW